MFDAGYSVTCRDAALPVGKMYKLRDAAAGPARLAAIRADKCAARRRIRATVADLGQVAVIDCKLKDSDVGYRAYELRKGRCSTRPRASPATTARSSSGFAASSPTSRSRARSRSRPPASATPPLRPRAGRDARPGRALAEAYRRNNAGNYAEAAEFFAAVSSSGDAPAEPRRRRSPTKRCRNRTSAATPKPIPCSRAPPNRSAPTRSSPAGCAIIAQSTCSTRATPRTRWTNSTSRSPRPCARGGGDGQDGARDRRRHRQAPQRRFEARPAARRRSPTSCYPRKRPRSSTARRCSCAARRCASAATSPAPPMRCAAPTPSSRPCAAATSPRSSGCARRSSAISRRSPKTRRTPRSRPALPPGRRAARGQLSGLGRASQRAGAARRLSRAHRPAGDRRDDVPRDRPFAARREQPAAVLRAGASALCRPPPQEGRRRRPPPRRFSPQLS